VLVNLCTRTPPQSRRTEITSIRTTRTVPQAAGAVQQVSDVAPSLSGRRAAHLASGIGPPIKANGIQRTAEHPTAACTSAFRRTTGRRTTCPTPILIHSSPVRPLQRPQRRPDQLPNRHRIFESLREIRSKRPTACGIAGTALRPSCNTTGRRRTLSPLIPTSCYQQCYFSHMTPSVGEEAQLTFGRFLAVAS
jgi:hypothetical protein